MSRNTKIILVIVVTLLAICCLCSLGVALLLPRFFQNTLTENPQQARQVGSQIADYTLPAGYSEQFSMDILTTKMVMIGTPGDTGMVFMLMQIAQPGVSREQMEAQMRQGFQQQFQSSTGPMTQVGTEQVTIKGQPVTFTIYEGRNTRTGEAVRQELGVFPGKGGTAMLMVYGPIATWDQSLISGFISSIH